MRLILLLLPALLSHVIWAEPDVDECSSAMNQQCHSVKEDLDKVSQEIKKSRFPLLKDQLESYDQKCQAVIDCSRKTPCYAGKSDNELFSTFCNPVGALIFPFETFCFHNILVQQLLGGLADDPPPTYGPNSSDVPLPSDDPHFLDCAKDYGFDLYNFTINKEVFISAKSCILKIVEKKCRAADRHFLEQNYEEIMDLYIPPADRENNGLCNQPSDRFIEMNCDRRDWIRLTAPDDLLNGTYIAGPEIVRLVRKIEECEKTSCLAKNRTPNPYSFIHVQRSKADEWEFAIGDLQSFFVQYPEWKTRYCTEHLRFEDVVLSYVVCKRVKSDCSLLDVLTMKCKFIDDRLAKMNHQRFVQ